MNQQRPQHQQHHSRRPQGQRRPRTIDIWRTPGPLPELELIAPPHEVGALLRSLGDPPMHRSTAAGHYFNIVAERAAAVAVALAFSADLLADPDAD